MNYTETVAYLYAALPMFQRIGAAAFKKDLGNTQALCQALGNPEKGLRFIHIAGTNGKGSVSHMLAACFQTQGYKTGLYTSPHLSSFTERIRINGVPIHEQAVVDFVAQYRNVIEKIKPSFFEITVVMAFWFFKQQKTEMVILETGMGGRLDSTNVVDPELSIITNIGWDHMQFLGGTLPEIAAEKAGIIKPQTPAVLGEPTEEILPVFTKKCLETQSTLHVADDWVHLEGHASKEGGRSIRVLNEGWEIQLPLGGAYQDQNFKTALAALRVYQSIPGALAVQQTSIEQGLSHFSKLTGLRGRWEILQKAPLVISDTAHNSSGWTYVMQQLKETAKGKKLHFVLGFADDKDLKAMVELLPEHHSLTICKPDVPRGMPVEKLRKTLLNLGLTSASKSSVAEAIDHALNLAGTEDVLYIGGSTFVVAETLIKFDLINS